MNEKKEKLTELMEKFCQEFIIDFNGAAAAVRAGYSKKYSDRYAYNLLRTPKIQARIKEILEPIKKKKSKTGKIEEIEF